MKLSEENYWISDSLFIKHFWNPFCGNGLCGQGQYFLEEVLKLVLRCKLHVRATNMVSKGKLSICCALGQEYFSKSQGILFDSYYTIIVISSSSSSLTLFHQTGPLGPLFNINAQVFVSCAKLRRINCGVEQGQNGTRKFLSGSSLWTLSQNECLTTFQL